MSHQPFETWILDHDTLSVEERRQLLAHVESCDQCQRLQRKWHMVSREMRARPTVAPAPGFTQRWTASLAERRAREQRKQAWRAFLGFLGGALVLLVILAGYALTVSSPAEWLAIAIRSGANTINLFNSLTSFVQYWLATTPLELNIALWIYLTITLCLLSLGWVFALWRTSNIGVLNK